MRKKTTDEPVKEHHHKDETRRELRALIEILIKENKVMAVTLDDALNALNAMKTTDDTVVTLLGTLKANALDQTKAQALVDGINAEKAKLDAAVAANQP
jgi:hypothetical protein